ncbi:MAG: DMT family transporter [Ruminococcaceae bacterium]|nr:DMT family transporter [Oscillospiraceae bacterium]
MDNSKNKLLTNKVFVAAMAMLCCALWGSATPFIKTGYKLIRTNDNVPSTILFAGVRFFFAGVLTVLIYSIARKKFLLPKKENLKSIATVSCFQTVLQYLFFYIGLSNTTGVKGAVISGSNCFFSILCATLIFRQEKLTPKKIFACLVGFAGIVLINLDGLSLNLNFMGDGFVLISNLAYGMSGALMKRYSDREDPVIISGYQFVMGGFVMILVGLLTGGVITIGSATAFGVMLYLSLLSAVAYSVWGILLKNNPVSSVSIYTFMTPVFGVLLSNLMLTEKSNVSPLYLIAALILICVGIFTLNYQRKKQNQ